MLDLSNFNNIIAVTGSKLFHDNQLFYKILDNEKNISLLISGAASGTDTLARNYAILNNIPFLEYPPDYINFGSTAKHIRDRMIVDSCGKLIAFWDGLCEGTRYTIEYAKMTDKPLLIIKI